MTTKETFSETEPILNWNIKLTEDELDKIKEVKFNWIDIIDKEEAYAESSNGHLTAIWYGRGDCNCEDFIFVKRELKIPCKHLIKLKEMM